MLSGYVDEENLFLPLFRRTGTAVDTDCTETATDIN